MEGTKGPTETRDHLAQPGGGRGACRGLRRRWVITAGAHGNADPGSSRSLVGWKSPPPQGPGFAGNVRQPAVSRS